MVVVEKKLGAPVRERRRRPSPGRRGSRVRSRVRQQRASRRWGPDGEYRFGDSPVRGGDGRIKPTAEAGDFRLGMNTKSHKNQIEEGGFVEHEQSEQGRQTTAPGRAGIGRSDSGIARGSEQCSCACVRNRGERVREERGERIGLGLTPSQTKLTQLGWASLIRSSWARLGSAHSSQIGLSFF